MTAPPELWPLVAASTIYAAGMRRRVLRSMRGVLIAGAVTLVFATAVITALVLDQLRPAPDRQPTGERVGGGAGPATRPFAPPTPPIAPAPPVAP